jgi:hypothetical protein
VKKIALLMLVALPVLTLIGQEVKKVQEPEYIGIVFSLDSTGTLIPLERQQANYQTKEKGLGYGGVQTSSFFKGSKSSVRFKAGQDIQFVVRPSSTAIEPDTIVKLHVLKVTKNQRLIVLAKTDAMGYGSKSTAGQSLLALNFARYGAVSLKFSPATPLNPGEYVITAGGQTGFLFGIDPQ